MLCFFKICQYTFFNISEGDQQKIGRGFFKICKYSFSEYWKRWSEKIGLGFFNICKYTFFNIWKMWSAKTWNTFFLRFVSILVLIFGKGDQQKIGRRFS